MLLLWSAGQEWRTCLAVGDAFVSVRTNQLAQGGEGPSGALTDVLGSSSPQLITASGPRSTEDLRRVILDGTEIDNETHAHSSAPRAEEEISTVRQVAAQRRGAAFGAAAAGAALAHYLPSTAVLATWLANPPEALPLGWCRWRGPAEQRRVALTFDDGPSPATTERTLDLLDRYGLRATFFVIGELVEAHPDLVREMRRRGHAVGSHGQRHEHHLLRRPSWIRADTARSVQVLRDVLDETPRWYRPPYGQLTTLTILEARRHAMEVVLWTRWGREFAEHEVQPVVDRLTTGATPGAILLLHDTDVSCPPGTAARTHAVLGPLAELLGARDLASVTLDELISP